VQIAHRTEALVTAGKLHFFTFVGSAGTNDGNDGDQGVDVAHVAHFAEGDHGGAFDVVHGASTAAGDEVPDPGIVEGAGGRRKAEGGKAEIRRPKSERRPKVETRRGRCG